MKKTAIVLLSLVHVLTYAQNEAGSSRGFSLEEAKQYAMENAYSVQDKQLEYEKARKVIKETAASGLPQINFSFGYQNNAQLAKQPVPAEFFGGEEGTFAFVAFGLQHQNNASLTLNQLIFSGSYFVALRASQVVKDIANLETEKSKIDIEVDVAGAYYLVLASEENERINAENLESLQKNLAETRVLFENGFSEEQDVDQLELLVNELQNNLDFARQTTDVSYRTLKFFMGIPQDEEISVTDDIDKMLSFDDNAASILTDQFNFSNHIQYRTMVAQEKAAGLQLSYDRSRYLPTLSGFVQHGQANFSNEFSEVFNFNTFWIPSTTIGISLNWNILEGLGRPASVQKAKLDIERIKVAKELTENNLKMNYEASRSNYEFQLGNYNNQKRNVDLSSRIRDRERIKFKEGVTSSFNLTQIETQYLNSQASYIQALVNLLNAKEELERSLGK